MQRGDITYTIVDSKVVKVRCIAPTVNAVPEFWAYVCDSWKPVKVFDMNCFSTKASAEEALSQLK